MLPLIRQEEIITPDKINIMDIIDSVTKKASNLFKIFIKKNILSVSFLTNAVYQRWAIAIVLCIILSVILAPEIHLINPKY